jgi:hypothetical protein
LVPVLAEYVEALERHGELRLDRETRRALLTISPATVDRLLARARAHARPHGLTTTKPGALLKHAIPVRTFAQWDDARPGFMEVDLVAHCGMDGGGEFVHSLDMVDVRTRWVELVAVVNRSQAAVTSAIDLCRRRLPYPLLGLDSDNGAEFINHQLKRYCDQHQITLTRSRPYRKNDQAFVEQKNWTAVRQTVGYQRFEGDAACRALNNLYAPLRLYHNFFQPVMTLSHKQRDGARVKKVYDGAKTPFQRILEAPEVDPDIKDHLALFYQQLNPAALRRQIDTLSAALAAFALPDRPPSPKARAPACGEPRFPAPLLNADASVGS